MDSLFDRHIEYLTEKDSALGFRLPVLRRSKYADIDSSSFLMRLHDSVAVE